MTWIGVLGKFYRNSNRFTCHTWLKWWPYLFQCRCSLHRLPVRELILKYCCWLKSLNGLGLRYEPSRSIFEPSILSSSGQVCVLSPESKLNMKRQHSVFMLRTSGINCRSAERLSSFKSRLETFVFSCCLLLIKTLHSTLTFNLLFYLVLFYYNFYKFFTLFKCLSVLPYAALCFM